MPHRAHLHHRTWCLVDGYSPVGKWLENGDAVLDRGPLSVTLVTAPDPCAPPFPPCASARGGSARPQLAHAIGTAGYPGGPVAGRSICPPGRRPGPPWAGRGRLSAALLGDLGSVLRADLRAVLHRVRLRCRGLTFARRGGCGHVRPRAVLAADLSAGLIGRAAGRVGRAVGLLCRLCPRLSDH